MRFAILFFVLTALFATACGTSIDDGTDVVIVVGDMIQSDLGRDVAVIGDNGQIDRDVVQDLAVDVAQDTADTVASDVGGSDEGPDDNGSDTAEVYVPQCWLGQDQCQPVDSTDRKTCENAQILGRTNLMYGGIKWNSDTINESTGGNKNDDNLDGDCPWFPDENDPLWCQSECDDNGLDHFFRVYLVPGDLFSFTVTDLLIFKDPDWGIHIDFMLKVYRGYECPLDMEELLTCVNEKDVNSPTYNNIQIKPMTAEEQGWYTIVLDSTDSEEAGTYTISASLFQNSEYTGEWSLCCDFPPL